MLTAGDILPASPISVTKDTDVMTLVDVLQNNHLIRVPVLDNVGNALLASWLVEICSEAIFKPRGVEAPRGVVLLLSLTCLYSSFIDTLLKSVAHSHLLP